MINMTTTLNAAKLLNYQLGWDNCRRWLNNEDVGAIFGAVGEIGGGKTTWLQIMLCSYLLGWNAALVHYKRQDRNKDRQRSGLYARRATLHSMPNRVALRDLLSISGRLRKIPRAQPIMMGARSMIDETTGVLVAGNSDNVCPVLHSLVLESVIIDILVRGRYVVWVVDEEQLKVPIALFVIHQLTRLQVDGTTLLQKFGMRLIVASATLEDTT